MADIFDSYQLAGAWDEMAGLSPPNGVRVHVAGIDLVRDGAGKVRVLEDTVRIPSGVSYVIENRLAMTRTFPALFSEQHVHPVYSYPADGPGALTRSRQPRPSQPGCGSGWRTCRGPPR